MTLKGEPLQVVKINGDGAVELLKDYQTKALIDVALRQTDESGEDPSHYPTSRKIIVYSFQYQLC